MCMKNTTTETTYAKNVRKKIWLKIREEYKRLHYKMLMMKMKKKVKFALTERNAVLQKTNGKKEWKKVSKINLELKRV